MEQNYPAKNICVAKICPNLPHVDINECESNDMCAGVGQWCVNKMGGHICCSSDSEEPECQGVHVFKTSDGEVMLRYNESHGDLLVEQAGSFSKNTSGGALITRHGFLKGEGIFPSVNVNRKNELMCTSYCPAQSECIGGVCRCMKGFGGNPLFGCEDIDECVTGNPCPSDPDIWCVNTFGSYQCCTPESTDTDCIGLEIAAGPDGGLRLTAGAGGRSGNREAFLASTLNQSFSGETLSQSIHEVRNFSAGEVLVVKNKVKTNIFEVKPSKGEVGLEISGGDIETGKAENATGILLGREVITEGRGSSGSIHSVSTKTKVGPKKGVGTRTTEEPLDGDKVGLEIVHNGATGTTTPEVEVGLEIVHVPRTTASPGTPDIITDQEPGDSQETIDGRPPKKSTTTTSTTPKSSEESGESTTSETTTSAGESEQSSTAAASTDETEASGEQSATISEPSSTTSQPDLILSMGTQQPGQPSSSTTEQPDLVLSMGTSKPGDASSTTPSSKESSESTDEPGLRSSTETTSTEGTTPETTTPEGTSAGPGESTTTTESPSTTEGTKELKSTTSVPTGKLSELEASSTTPKPTSTEATSTAESSTTSISTPKVDIDDEEGSGLEKDEHGGKGTPEKITSTSTALPSTTAKGAESSGRTPKPESEEVTSTGAGSTTTSTSTSSSSTTVSPSGTTPESTSAPSTVSSSPSTSSTDSSDEVLSSTTTSGRVTGTTEPSREEFVKPEGAQRSPKPE
ncbi:hypothetical protein OESDEN_14303, partial [Oesophagostomum dentatum]